MSANQVPLIAAGTALETRRRTVLSSLSLPATEMEIISGGFYSDVIVVTNNGTRTVVKLVRGKSPINEGDARALCDDLVTYHNLLDSHGVPISKLRDVHLLQNPETTGFEVVQIVDYAGVPADRVLQDAPHAKIGEVLERMLEILQPVFHQREDSGDLSFGIDPKHSNFTILGGEMFYVDTMPPRFRRNGVALVEMPQPRDPRLYEQTYQRYYTVTGVLRILETQLLRARPDAWSVVVPHIRFAASGHPNTLAELRELDDTVDRMISDRDGIMGIDGDMYLVRSLGCALYARNALSREGLDRLYHLTHFDVEDGIDPIAFEEAKLLLANLPS